MKTKMYFKNLLALAILITTSICYAQEPNVHDLFDQDNIDGRTINGTTTYDGLNAGTVGNYGSYFGANAAPSITATTYYNTMMGSYSGYLSTTGSYNTFIGTGAGYANTTGNSNVALGFLAGRSSSTGTGNLFLGYYAGYYETGSNKLYIDNTLTTTPLVYGDFATNKLGINTNQLPNSVGGANTSAYSLYVKGGILTEELRVRTGWADYVFDDNYSLKPLEQVEAFIFENGHLPNIPSAAQVEAQGIELGDMARLQQEKIEELTLYVIQQQKQINELKSLLGDLMGQK